MAAALYGEHGFYARVEGPQRHFRTSATASPLFAGAIRRLAGALDDALGHPAVLDVVDVGAGDGSLLTGVAAVVSDDERARWRLHGVDLRGRPAGLPDGIGWSAGPPERIHGLVVAHELLDNVPVDVVEQTESGPRLVLVDLEGVESLGDRPGPADLQWLDRWWRLDGAEPGDRAEVGRARDDVWARLVASLDRGVAVAVDYAHHRDDRQAGRYPAGTLTGYREGRQVAPVPDGTCDLTAHVALDACAAAGIAAGATATLMTNQRDALAQLGVTAALPDRALASEDPAAYVRSLSEASQAAELRQRGGLGDFGWLLQSRDTQVPLPHPPSRHPHPVSAQGSPHSAL